MDKKIIAVILLWICIAFGWVIKNEFTLNTVREVMGDYVVLGFKIGELKYRERENYNKEKPVYVFLKTNEKNIAKRSKITQIKPDSHDKNLYIKGEIKNNRILFGIENYYVKEKTGKTLEKELRNGAFVKVKIDKFGNAKVVGFINK